MLDSDGPHASRTTANPTTARDAGRAVLAESHGCRDLNIREASVGDIERRECVSERDVLGRRLWCRRQESHCTGLIEQYHDGSCIRAETLERYS